MSQPLGFGTAFEVVTARGVIWHHLAESVDTPSGTVLLAHDGGEYVVRAGRWARGRSGMTAFAADGGAVGFCTITDAAAYFHRAVLDAHEPV